MRPRADRANLVRPDTVRPSRRLSCWPSPSSDRWSTLAWPVMVVLAVACATLLAWAPAHARASMPSTASPEATPTARPLLMVVHDGTPLLASPRPSAPGDAGVLVSLWRGDMLEWRATAAGGLLQVWDPHRERGGFVRAAQVHRIDHLDAAALAVLLQFVQDQGGHEATTLTLAAALLHALPPTALQGPDGAAALDALGTAAERLADRASSGTPPRAADQAALQGHLAVAQRLGVKLVQRAGEDQVQVCYDGDAHRRVLSMASATPTQRARAALALTRSECLPQEALPRQREAIDAWRAEVLDRVGPGAPPSPWHDRLAIRRATVWATLAWARARREDAPGAAEAADRALTELGRVDRQALDEAEERRFHDAALHVNAVRWAVVPVPHPAGSPNAAGTGSGSTLTLAGGALTLQVTPRADGQTCVALQDRRHPAGEPLAQRCTWGRVWSASASANREGNAVALAVQPTDGWRELWVLHRAGAAPGSAWSLQVLPPAAAGPGLGYAEWAGWVPGGRQLLVAREAHADGRRWRRFEVVDLATLVPERTAFDPQALGPFQRWSDPQWKARSLALR
ncbi:MAG: hypothetical protein ACOVQT_13675 [Rubrivivax sp.]|jgi:hypothetical protein